MSTTLRSLAVYFPNEVRTNDYYRRVCPDVVAQAEQKALKTPWTADDRAVVSRAFDVAMAPYLADPFRGTQLRHVVAPGQTALDMEMRAAQTALDAASMSPDEVDLVILTSFLPDTRGIGHAAFLARELRLGCAAWNLETACTSAMAALDVAHALVASERYRNVLIVQSCMYTRYIDDSNVLSWTTGDGAAAMLIGPSSQSDELLATCMVNTSSTCGAFFWEPSVDANGHATLRLNGSQDAGRLLRETSAHYVSHCCSGALRQAGVRIDDIACVVTNTPIAWFADFVATVLDVPPAKVTNAFPLYGNVGPVLLAANLHLAAMQGRLRPGDLVLLYSIGSGSSAGAAVMRWSDSIVVAPWQPVDSSARADDSTG